MSRGSAVLDGPGESHVFGKSAFVFEGDAEHEAAMEEASRSQHVGENGDDETGRKHDR